MTKKEALKFIAIRSLGNFLLLFAIYGVIATFGPVVLAEVKYKIVETRGVKFKVAQAQEVPVVKENKTPDTPSFSQVLSGSREQVIVAKDSHFSILIPKIGANSKVYPNIDPTNESEFLEVLKHGVAHAKGSVFPGISGNTYLFAHSVDNWWNVGRYNAVFYLLKDLSEGDEIVVFFENKRFNYVVSQKVISDPTDISFLSQAQKGEQKLVLQTCWPPGTTWKRLYVIAVPGKKI